jgi:hypothetical protein
MTILWPGPGVVVAVGVGDGPGVDVGVGLGVDVVVGVGLGVWVGLGVGVGLGLPPLVMNGKKISGMVCLPFFYLRPPTVNRRANSSRAIYRPNRERRLCRSLVVALDIEGRHPVPEALF